MRRWARCFANSTQGVKVPNGFAITAEAYRYFLRRRGWTKDPQAPRQISIRATWRISASAAANSPGDSCRQAAARSGDGNHRRLRHLSGPNSIRPMSPCAAAPRPKICPTPAFAGQQETYLNVQGHRPCWMLASAASLRSSPIARSPIGSTKASTISKSPFPSACSGWCAPTSAASGVMFTIDTETGFRDAVLINAAYGLGENIVQGPVNPDEYYVFKPTLKQGFRPILQKIVGTKEFKLVYDIGGGKMVKNVPVPPGDRAQFAISDDEILKLARWACLIEDHYSAKKGHPTPMDIEWAKDGHTGELFIVQARPETVQSRKDADVMETYQLKQRGPVLITGRSVGEKIASGSGARHQERAVHSTSSRKAKFSSPTRPIPTGSRS